MTSRGLRTRVAAALLLVAACALVSCATTASAPHANAASLPPLHVRYVVRFIAPSADSVALDVALSFDGAPRRFMFTRPGAVHEVRVRTPRGETSLPVPRDGRLELPDDATGLSYRYDPARLTHQHLSALYTGAGGADGFLVAGRSYLIRPRVADGVTAELVVEGADALLPWAPGEDGRWRVSGGALVDSGFHAFNGRRCTRKVEETVLEISLLGPKARMEDEYLCGWVERSAREAMTIRSPLPYRRITVHLVPVSSDEASVLGLLLWSTPPSLALTVGSDADAAAFGEDWVALHELVHVLHPSFPGEAPWLSEGLATYLTEVGRMRSGRRSEAEGWAALASGFVSARDEAEGGDLGELVAGLRHGRYRPVYWAGALISLELDLEIRRATKGERALEDVLVLLTRDSNTSTLQRFGEAVDEVAGTPVFERVRRAHADGPALARVESLLSSLGVRRSGDGVELVDAPLAETRRGISAARSR